MMPSILFAAALLAQGESEPPRFETVRAGEWTITDEGPTCDATFAVAGEPVLTFSGQTYGWTDGPSGGSIHHIGFGTGQYDLPKGEFAVTISVPDGPSFGATGEAVELSGGLLVFADRRAPAFDILARLPVAGPIAFSVDGRELFRVMLSGNDRAIAAHNACMAFITAQKRPGTRDSGRMPEPPKPLPLEPLPPPPPIVPETPDETPPSLPPADPVPIMAAPARPDAAPVKPETR